MNSFVKTVFASCLGVILAVLGVIFILMLVGLGLSGGKPQATEGVLTLDLSKTIPEKTGNVQTNNFNFSSEEVVGLRETLRLLKKAKTDDKIKGILLQYNSNSNGLATSEALSDGIKDFKNSGKFVYAYADFYSQGAYLSVIDADSIFLNPNGGVDLKGYATMYPFFKGFLDKIGVRFDVFYAGEFKSASEPFRRSDMSPQNKAQTREFLNDIFHQTLDRLEECRGLSQTDIDRIIERQDGARAITALQSKLVDKVCYWDEVQTAIKQRINDGNADKVNLITLEKYKQTNALSLEGKITGDKIALVFAEGDVTYGSDQKGSISDENYIKILQKIRKDKKVKAVVLRVNSGGGSALTSDIIWREIENIKEQGIPVIASFGDYAASGGYYIACGADTIVAEKSTLTGSIGVFSMLPNAQVLFNEKLGITFDTVKTHTESIQESNVLNMTDVQRKRFQESTDEVYSQFLDRVAVGRKMPKDSVHQYAQGHIWSGTKAKEIGLVDVIGSLDDAIRIASEKAGLSSDFRIVEYPKIEQSFFEQIVKQAMASQEEDESVKHIKSLFQDAIYMHKMINQKGVQAKMPYLLNVE